MDRIKDICLIGLTTISFLLVLGILLGYIGQ